MKNNRDRTYYVYRLFFEGDTKSYIGFSYKVNKRLWDHNSKAKLGSSTTKSDWLRQNYALGLEIVVETLYTGTYDECYAKELEFIKHYFHNGGVVNSNRLKEAGLGDGYKNVSPETTKRIINKFSKKYIIINKQGIVTVVDRLRNFSIESGINYKDLCACSTGKVNSSGGLKVIKYELWEVLNEEEQSRIIETFKLYNPHETKERQLYADSIKKEFWILHKNGHIEYGKGITIYCKLMGYNSGNMVNTHRNGRPQMGKMLFYSFDELQDFIKNKMHFFYYKMDKDDKVYVLSQVVGLEKYSKQMATKAKELAKHFHKHVRTITDIIYKN